MDDSNTLGCVITERSRATKVRQCPSCKQGMYKSGGCDHIVCRCRYQFYYLCAAEYCPELQVPAILFIRHTEDCHYRSTGHGYLCNYSVYGLDLDEHAPDMSLGSRPFAGLTCR